MIEANLDTVALMIDLKWNADLQFDASTPSGHTIHFDTLPGEGAGSAGPTPMETLLASIAACSAMDVISILEKKRQVVTGYRMEVEGERTTPGEWPRPFKSIQIRHFLQGENLDPDAVDRAVALSDEKYCSVVATLRATPEITTTWAIATKKP